MAGYGGAREGAGRKPLGELKRKTRSVVVRDDEWEVVKAFVAAVKNGRLEECKAFVQELEERG